jgi:uncharacterized protein (DUF58 family)
MKADSTTIPGKSALIDPATLMRLQSLEWRARMIVEGTRNGLHRSPYHGFSVEFTEYRQYTPGDDLRHLDWRVFARSDRYEIKRFEDETNLRCHLVVDQSRSMSFGSTGYSKADYASTLAATLAYFLELRGDAVGLLTFGDTVQDYLPPRHRTGHFRQLLRALEKEPVSRDTHLTAPVERLLALVPKRGMMVWISDFLAPLEGLEPLLASWVAIGHEVIAFQVLDPKELSFDYSEPTRLEDLETGRTLPLDPSAMRGDYLSALTAHNRQLQTLCERLGVGFLQLPTHRPLELALTEFLDLWSRTGRHRSRVTSSPGRA